MKHASSSHNADPGRRRGGLGALAQLAVLALRSPWPWLAALVVAAGLYALRRCEADPPRLAVEHHSAIDVTPEEIREIRNIREWEFLSISTEELVEACEPGTLGDRQIARIYEGTLRLGIRMDRAGDDWFSARGDTACLRLPDVGLLDDDFIDEARTRAFYEKGTWPASTRERLYQQARTAMLRRHLTEENLRMARENAREQFTKIFQGFGFRVVDVKFIPSGKQLKNNEKEAS